ncbi:hypothetical protein OKW38_002925 [Paraburkholderia sp. MM5496-R1]
MALYRRFPSPAAACSAFPPGAAPGEIIYSEGYSGEPVVFLITEGKVELSTRCDDMKVVDSFDVLNPIAQGLQKDATGNVLVEGHTDSVPISTAKYASNWELSSARAGAVVRYLVERGIEPHRLAAIGRADNFPLVAGNDAAARAANRRVAIVVQY